MAWTIAAGPSQVDTSRDATSWQWEIERESQRRKILVNVAGTAMASRDLLPEDTRKAKETEGRSEVEGILDEDDPPASILCTTAGCNPEMND